MDQDELRDSIDELYAIQKQAGDRMVELTQENKAILSTLEKSISSNMNEIIKDGNRYLWMLIIVNAVCISAFMLLFYNFNNEFDKKIAQLELMTRRSASAALVIVEEMEKLQKQNAV
jgi:hypothetical protein